MLPLRKYDTDQIGATVVRAEENVSAWMHAPDAAMIGRAAYANPNMLAEADSEIFGFKGPPAPTRIASAILTMVDYLAEQKAMGARLSSITRHLTPAFHGQRGSKAWKRAIEAVARSNGSTHDMEHLHMVATALTSSND
eukprot:SAG31_NODE_17140_length_682_cov_0.571184_1_plen_139_part_00